MYIYIYVCVLYMYDRFKDRCKHILYIVILITVIITCFVHIYICVCVCIYASKYNELGTHKVLGSGALSFGAVKLPDFRIPGFRRSCSDMPGRV